MLPIHIHKGKEIKSMTGTKVLTPFLSVRLKPSETFQTT